MSKHHYAVHLARRGSSVFFLNPPRGPAEVKPTAYENVFEINYNGFPMGLRYYPRMIQRRIFSATFARIERICGVRFDVVWSFDNSVFFDFNALPSSAVKISHIVDLNQDFQTKRAAASADYCICNSELIKKRLLNYSTKVVKISHGFNLGSSPGPITGMFAKKAKVTALYTGNLAMPYIDWRLLRKVIQRFPEIEFVFIGPDQDPPRGNAEKNEIFESPNTQWVGKVDADLLPAFYQDADILLIAYKEKYHKEAANPHKMMEYLGSGKVVVATHTFEYAGMDPLVVMSNRNSEWPDLFSTVSSSLDIFNTESLQNRRRAFAAANSYENHISKIEQIIFSEKTKIQ